MDRKQQQDAVGTADKAAVPWRAGLGPRMSFSLDDEAVLFQVCSHACSPLFYSTVAHLTALFLLLPHCVVCQAKGSARLCEVSDILRSEISASSSLILAKPHSL